MAATTALDLHHVSGHYRFGEAWASIEQEVVGGGYRFASALQRYGFLHFRFQIGDAAGVLGQFGSLFSECRALNRMWMQENLVDIVATIGARYGLLDEAYALLRKLAPDLHPRTQAAAEVELAPGATDIALGRSEALRSSWEQSGKHLLAADAAELAIRCFRALERWEEIPQRATKQLEFCGKSSYLSLQWCPLAHRAKAYLNIGEPVMAAQDHQDARRLLQILGDRMPRLELKEIYLSQPLAIEVLGSA